MNWISVRNCLPDIAGYMVLVCGVNMFGQSKCFMAFTGYGNGDFSFFTSDKTIDISKWEITHWMLLPELPL